MAGQSTLYHINTVHTAILSLLNKHTNTKCVSLMYHSALQHSFLSSTKMFPLLHSITHTQHKTLQNKNQTTKIGSLFPCVQQCQEVSLSIDVPHSSL